MTEDGLDCCKSRFDDSGVDSFGVWVVKNFGVYKVENFGV
jgi:hypothetical protein